MANWETSVNNSNQRLCEDEDGTATTTDMALDDQDSDSDTATADGSIRQTYNMPVDNFHLSTFSDDLHRRSEPA